LKCELEKNKHYNMTAILNKLYNLQAITVLNSCKLKEGCKIKNLSKK